MSQLKADEDPVLKHGTEFLFAFAECGAEGNDAMTVRDSPYERAVFAGRMETPTLRGGGAIGASENHGCLRRPSIQPVALAAWSS
jgi:hypothetical protein